MSLPLVYPANHEGLPAMMGYEAGLHGYEKNPWPEGSEAAEIWQDCRNWVQSFPGGSPPFGYFAESLDVEVH